MNRLLLSALLLIATVYLQAQSPYISVVFDYSPAPGQFINLIPKYEQGDTKEAMTRKAHEALVNNKKSMVCLGGFGGSITFGFDHPIDNVPGQYDFQILGNAVLAESYSGSRAAGSAEPGIIQVSFDENENGLPDDTWYEIAGSEYSNPATKHNLTITYYRPSADHVPVPSLTDNAIVDSAYIAYRCSDGATGYIPKNSFHAQDYFPQWVADDSIVFAGRTLLPPNAEYAGSRYLLYCYDYGYADNYPNGSEMSNINIDWAVDSLGNKANLSAIQFVRVYTGVNQSCGWIGETSTEIVGAVDLHFADALYNPESECQTTAVKQYRDGRIYILRNGKIYDILGVEVSK